MIRIRTRHALCLAAAAAAALALITAPLAGAGLKHIEAHCEGSRAVVTSRPRGAEHVIVTCQKGLPEFMVAAPAVAEYDPVTQELPMATPPDFGGWVTVWLNDRPLKTPYDPLRGVKEPGVWLTASTGRVMIPVRFFTEAFGGQVDWHHNDRRVGLAMPNQGKRLQVTIGQTEAQVNGTAVSLDQPALLFLDRTFVPIRFLAEGFGAAVEWDHANRSVWIYLSGARCDNPVYCGEVR